ncbi:MAG: hypothetical protein H7315_22115 [Herminiimonas sp.]|nr:hypothetical protein [Herminiimonas sp.]
MNQRQTLQQILCRSEKRLIATNPHFQSVDICSTFGHYRCCKIVILCDNQHTGGIGMGASGFSAIVAGAGTDTAC